MSIIQKNKITIILFLVLLILSACAEKNEIIKDEKVYMIEDIRFEENDIFFDTEQETLVYSPYDLVFRKTKEPSYIHYKITEDRNWLVIDLLTGIGRKEKTIDVFINEDAVKDVSRKYATQYKETLIFTDDNK